MKAILLFIVSLSFSLAEPPTIVSGEKLGKLWKRTKSLTAPVEKIRKGLGVEVDGVDSSSKGDPVAKPKPVEVKVDADTACSFQNIQFQLDKAELVGSTTFSQLSEIAKGMTAAGTEKFLIEGHTCDLGTDARNLTLSQERALAVKAALIGLGISADRLQIMGFGQTDPMVKNTDEASRAQNRRVQVFRKI